MNRAATVAANDRRGCLARYDRLWPQYEPADGSDGGPSLRLQVECWIAQHAPLTLQRFPMSISMYQASVPRFLNILGNLSNILDKAQSYADAKKLEPVALTSFRLFPRHATYGKAGADRLRYRQGRCGAALRVSRFPSTKTTRRRWPTLKASRHQDHRLHSDYNGGTGRRHRRQGNRDQAPRQGDALHRHAIPARPRGAEFLLSRDDDIQHAASQRRGDRQARLPR